MATYALDGVSRPVAWTERNLGWMSEVGALALLALTVAGLLANAVLGDASTPAAYAERYVAARAAGDAPGVWDAIRVDSAPKADASLLNETALAAMLRLPANRSTARDLIAQTVSVTSASATIDVTYRDGAASRKTELRLVRSPSERLWLLYQRWRVVTMPKVLQLPSLVPGTLVSVDGLPIPASAKTVAVFPGSHQVAVGASRLLEGDTATVMASTGIVPVTFKAKLTQEAQRQAAAVVGTAFAACAKATTLAPPNCPQSVIDNINGAATWQLFGDPAVGTSLAVGDGATVLVDGHYQMAVSYEGQYPDVQRHRAIAGAYEAELAWDGTALGLRSLGQPKTAVTEMPRPAADDATVLAAVRGAFDRCATVTTLDPADCPQYIKAYGEVAAVSWRLDRDPVTGATVSFNGSQGMFRVVGTYSMTAKYDETYQYQPTFHRSMQSTGRYTADLVWDGQKLVFVTFE